MSADSGSDRESNLGFQYPNADNLAVSTRDVVVALIVIAVIGVVAGAIVAHQRDQANTVVCAANLRQIGIALQEYAQDNDESVPNRIISWPATMTAWHEREAYTWRRAILPYVTKQGVFRCPSNPVNDRPTGCVLSVCGTQSSADGLTVSYGCNFNNQDADDAGTGDGYCGGEGAPPNRLSNFTSPSALIAVVESTSPWSEFDVLKPAFGSAVYAGHSGICNYLFADGHVIPFHPLDTLSPTNMWVGDGAIYSRNSLGTARRVLSGHT